MLKKGILFVNLGSPDSPSIKDIRSYLKEFLSDPRVMTMPTIIRWMLLNFYILPLRPKKIKPKYEFIWDGEGFPLVSHSRNLADKVADVLGKEFTVRVAMRYGLPSIEQEINQLHEEGVSELLVFPLFPQYSSATTGSVVEKAMEVMKNWQILPKLIINSHFYDHASFIESWCKKGDRYWEQKPDHVLFSFHGLPESHIIKGDSSGKHCLKTEDCCSTIDDRNYGCYRAQCFKSAKMLASALSIPNELFSISFQSRLGKAKWLEPHTVETVRKLAADGIKKLLVFCPSFVADCLETTEEIQFEVKDEFIKAGGKELELVPSLNSDSKWAVGLAEIIRENFRK
ncbi:ferrochelatase [bacterium]|nr:ferrochelatase [bacterium]